MFFKRSCILVLLILIMYSRVCLADDKFRYKGGNSGILQQQEQLTAEEILESVGGLQQVKITLTESLSEDIDYKSLPGTNESPQEVILGRSIVGNRFSESYIPYYGADIRRRIVGRAYEYLEEQTEYGRIGYSQGYRNSWQTVNGVRKFWLDCSSFVGKVYEDCGVTDGAGKLYTPAMYTGTWSTCGVNITWSEIQPGDIMNRVNPGHVGLYVGDGTIEVIGSGGKSRSRQVYEDVHVVFKRDDLSYWMDERQGYVPIRPRGLP